MSAISVSRPPVLDDGTKISGELTVPARARGIAVFVHGSGSARHSQHDRFVAEYLQDHGFGTLLLDVLTLSEEAQDLQRGSYRMNIELLAHRILTASDKLTNLYEPGLPLAYIGVGTGAAAALVAAARRPSIAAAIVCRSGRPDLASFQLESVRTPTLLLVGGNDVEGMEANRRAYGKLACVRELCVIPGADHLFDGPGDIECVAKIITEWLTKHVKRL